jgi:D-lactate dehydrogenase (cytochrome)
MATTVIQANAAPPAPPAVPVRDPEILAGYLEDASGNPPGHAAGLVRASSESEIAAFLKSTLDPPVAVLPQGARSSLTEGASPRGEVILSAEKLVSIGRVETWSGGGRAVVGPGVRLKDLQRELASRGLYYPPVPTYQDAMIGGTVSTNAGGAATFKYGVTRQWIRALRVVLFNGDIVQIERGQALSHSGQPFLVRLSSGALRRVPVPTHSLPPLKKLSAGYFAADPLDLVDLFIGSEGTLGLISEVTIDLVPAPHSVVTGLVFLGSAEEGLGLAAALREAALRARANRDARGPDMRSIEIMDGRCLRMLRVHGDSGKLRITVPPASECAILFEMELPEATSNADAEDTLAGFLERGADGPDVPLSRLLGILAANGALETLELAFPEDAARREALHEFREAAPKRVNEILAGRRWEEPGIHKVGGDLIVPFERLPEMLRIYETGFERRGLDFAVWGHASDGNLHPNAIPKSAAEATLAVEALLEFADEAVRRGGAPLSEHGVGRSPLKQQLLERFLGPAAIEGMRCVKLALDPVGRFAPGVLFPNPGPPLP